MTSVFLVQYFNTALLVVCQNANLEDSVLSVLPSWGTYPDFSVKWYTNVGPVIVLAMALQAIMPLVSFTIQYLWLTIKRWFDKGICSCFDCCLKKHPRRTRKSTIEEYMNLHSGPEMQINYRYSMIVSMTFVTFTHGCALPILFPICWLGITILYILEALLIAHFYRQPPIYDKLLNDKALTYLMFAPLTMMLMAYWQLGNRQTFFNEVQVKEYAREITPPDHGLI